jgi:transposase
VASISNEGRGRWNVCRFGRVAQGNGQTGTRVLKARSEPAAFIRLIRRRASDVERIGLESGPTSVWLTHALKAGAPVGALPRCRHAQAVLSMRPNKSDRGDARGLAEMVRVGWFKIQEVRVKSLASHERKALLIARHQLVDMRVRLRHFGGRPHRAAGTP